jgi:hypothetical protein
VDESSKLGLQVVTQADGEEEESELLREAFGTPKPRVQAGEKALLKVRIRDGGERSLPALDS